MRVTRDGQPVLKLKISYAGTRTDVKKREERYITDMKTVNRTKDSENDKRVKKR